MKQQTLSRTLISTLGMNIAILIVLNLISNMFFYRLDLSRNRSYTLGKASKEAVRKLEDNIVIKIYASKELPSDFMSLNRYLKDLLTEYKVYGKRRFSFEYVKAQTAEDLQNQASMNNLGIFRVQSFENDQISLKEVVFGLTFEYKGKIERLNFSPNEQSKIEYEITSLIKSMANVNRQELFVWRDSTFYSYPTEIFSKNLESNYKVISTDLNTPLSQGGVLLITGVREFLSWDQLYNLDQYIMHGGKIVLLQDRTTITPNAILEINTNLFSLLNHYGIEIKPNMVMDYVCDEQRTGISKYIPFPIFPVVRGTDNSIITRNIDNIVLYVASELALTKKNASLKFEPILQTSSNSGLVKSPDFAVDPNIFNVHTREQFPLPPITVGAKIEGRITSYFADDPVRSANPDFKKSIDDAEFVIFGDRDLSIDQDNNLFRDRAFIVFNAVDYLQGNESMIKIRSKSLLTSMLNIRRFLESYGLMYDDITKTEIQIKTGIKVVCLVLPSLLLALLGIFFFSAYQKHKRSIK